jgi:hypothetical protein
MDRISSEEILLAARKLRPAWRSLLGDATAARAEDLLASLDSDNAEDVRRTSNQLLELFSKQSAVTELREAIVEERSAKGIGLTSHSGGHEIGKERLYQPLPGGSAPVASPDVTYRCPLSDCDYTWRPQALGKPVPFCPHHPDHRLVKV